MEKYIIPDFCFVRTPAYPLDLLNQLYLKKDLSRESISTELKKIFSDHSIQTALHGSSSRTFYAEFMKWMEGTKSPRENEKIEETLIKYLARMTTRCVPFGLFSGFSIANVASNTGFQLNSTDKNISHLRMDMEYIQDIIYTLCADEKIKRSVRYYRNSSIYRVNDKFKYVEYTTDTYIRKYNYTAVAYEEYLDMILQEAEKGIHYSRLIELLMSYDDAVSDEEAREYIDQLISAQLLVSELEPNVTGKDNLTQIVDILMSCEGNEKYIGILKEIQSLLQIKKYQIEKANHIRGLAEEITGPKDYWSILQTDLEISTTNNTIGEQVLQTISQQIQNLAPFAYGIDRPALITFKQDFVARYDTQEVPLTEAIDPDIGIGYGNLGINTSNPLLKDIIFEQESGEPVRVLYNALTEFVTDKYIECIQNGALQLDITDEDLKSIKEKGVDKKLPDNFFMHGALVATSPQELDKGNFLFQLKNLSGPPSCLTLGRFCYTSEYLTEKIKSCIATEEDLNKDAIYAEIVHLTDARVGNVTIRPHLRSYEIPYLGKSGMDVAHQIPVTDIMVSIRDNSIRLRSKKLNKQIIPRLTNAHVFTESYLPIYKFLGDCQRDRGSDWMSWHWQYLKNQKFLPRVQYKNIVLKTAKWLLKKEDLPARLNKADNINLTEEFRLIADKLSIPRFVSFFEDLDKEFIFDLNSEISCRLIMKELHKNGKILLEEYLQPIENCWIGDANNCRYVNEIMVPVNKVITNDEAKPFSMQPLFGQVERKFSFGSKWIYFKLYASRMNAEVILIDYLYDFIRQTEEENSIISWHFLRYGDPEYHLRIRFNLAENNAQFTKIIESFNRVFTGLQEQKIVYKVQIDTYDREVERYGARTIEDSEKIFSIDSSACLAFIKLSENYEEENERWLWAIKAIDMLLNAFKYSTDNKQRLLSGMEKYELKRCNGNKSIIKQANAKYKLFEKEIKNLLSENGDTELLTEYLQAGMPVLEERFIQLEKIAPVIVDKVSIYHEVALDHLTASYIHMFINRLFVSNPNKCEFVIYTLLNRYYFTAIKTKVAEV